MRIHKSKRVVALLSLLTCFSFITKSQTNLDGRRNVVTTSVSFLSISPDSRAGALGDAGVATTPDANSIHWNPAKLAFVENDFAASLSYVPWLKKLVPDINLSYLSGYMRIDKMSTFGASLRYFSLGDITFTNDIGEYLGDFRPNELAVDGAYARKLSDNFSLGLALRFIYSNLAGNTPVSGGRETKPGTAFAGDISAYYQFEEQEINNRPLDISLGINISNIGSKITYTDETDKDFIPINLRLGGYFNYHIDDYNQIALIIDLNKLLVPTLPIYQVDSNGNSIRGENGDLLLKYGKNPDVPVVQGMIQSFSDAPAGFTEEMREITPSIGVEYWYMNQIAGRAGYFYEHETKGNRQYMTLGLGIKYSRLQLDVSYLIPTNNKTASQSSPLGDTVRFTLAFNFGENE